MGSNGKWHRFKLCPVCTKIGSGATPRGGSKVYLYHGEVALLRSQNVYNEGFNRNGLVYINQEHAEQLSNVEVLGGDVLLNITGDSVARCCQVPNDVLPARVNQHVAIIRPDPEKLDSRYLRYFLVSPAMQGQMLSWAGTGGTRNALTKGMIESFEIPAPDDIQEQQAIAHILGSLDDKVELNRQMNETLEAIAQAIFKSWFVDFDPVRAKAEGRDPGLPKEIADLFPDSFEESELGEIPKGWKVSTIGDILELAYGKALKASNRRPGTVPVYGSNGRVGWHDEKLAQGPGIVVGRKGNPGIVTWVPTDFFPIDTTFYVAPKDSALSILFLFYALQGQNLPSLGADSAVPGLNRNMAYMNQWVIPPAELVRAFDNKCFPFYGKIQEYNEESLSLTALRDTLLPKLLSGELRVPDYEKLMGDIA